MKHLDRKQIALCLQITTVVLLFTLTYLTWHLAMDMRRILIMFEQSYDYPEGGRYDGRYEIENGSRVSGNDGDAARRPGLEG